MLLASGCLVSTTNNGTSVPEPDENVWSVTHYELGADVAEADFTGDKIQPNKTDIGTIQNIKKIGDVTSVRFLNKDQVIIVAEDETAILSLNTWKKERIINDSYTLVNNEPPYGIGVGGERTNLELMRVDGAKQALYLRFNGSYGLFNRSSGGFMPIAETPKNNPVWERPVKDGLLLRYSDSEMFLLNSTTGVTSSYGKIPSQMVSLGPDGRLYYGDNGSINARSSAGPKDREVLDLSSHAGDPSGISKIPVYGVNEDYIIFGIIQEDHLFSSVFVYRRDDSEVVEGPRAISGNDIMMMRPQLINSRYRFGMMTTKPGWVPDREIFLMGEYDLLGPQYTGSAVKITSKPRSDYTVRWDTVRDHIFLILSNPYTNRSEISLHRYGSPTIKTAIAPESYGSIQYIAPVPGGDSWLLANNTAVFEVTVRRPS